MIVVSGSSVATNSATNKVAVTGISIKTNTGATKNSIASYAIIRTGGGGGVYKTVTETKAIHKDETIDNTYYIYTSFASAGDPVSVIIHFGDDDAQYLGKCSVSGKQVSFASEDDVFGLNCTISYLYSVL